MALTKTQIELLETIQSKMRRGDISSIAEKVGLTKEYVGTVLNPKLDRFNEDIVKEAIELINTREQNTKKLLQTLTSDQ